MNVSLLFQNKTKVKKPENGFDAPFEEVDHDAVRLAREFERKYGNVYGGCDGRSMKKSLIMDKGSGYDENNGFIDDSEAVGNSLKLLSEQAINL